VKTVSLEVVWNNDFIIDDNYGITREIIFSFYSKHFQQLWLLLWCYVDIFGLNNSVLNYLNLIIENGFMSLFFL